MQQTKQTSMNGCQHASKLAARFLRPAFRSGTALRQHSTCAPRRALATTPCAKARRGLAELLSFKNEEDERPRLKQGKVAPELEVPQHILRPPYAAGYDHPPWTSDVEVHDEEGIRRMRASCKLAAQVLQHAGTLVKPGVTTDEIDRAVHKMIIDNGAYPSPLRYGKFPKSVCTSVNECVCHGIPDSRPLEDGDIVNIDVTVYLDGYHGDTSSMFTCGKVDAKAQRLCDATKEALDAAIKVCKPGAPTRQIGAACTAVADKHKLQIIAEFCGHGVGKVFHASPMVIHDRNNQRDKMQLWQTFTIEPILCTGAPRHRVWPDKWTVVTKDGGLAAQYEHTILITPDGAEVLTVA